MWELYGGMPGRSSGKKTNTMKEMTQSEGLDYAGLSTSAGLTYSGERFGKYFFDFIEKFGIRDTYTTRSEERRVGKECRSRWSPYH